MKKTYRVLKVILYLLLIIIVSGYFFVSYISKRAVPDYNKEVFLKGLTDEVKVYRDSFAIPHIYAKNEEDLYRTSGYVMAQDRLWQMDLIRRATQGRLSEIFGEDLINTDLLLRALKIPEKSRMMLNDSSFGEKLLVEAFADGINQYIEQNIHSLPPEFAILGYNPDKWEPEHSLNAVGYMAWDLSRATYSTEILLYKIIKELGWERAQGLVPEFSNKKAVIYPGFNIDKSLLDTDASMLEADKKLDELGLKIFLGSNNWAISGEKSVTGMPLLANDMHLGLSAPGIWYQIHQVVEGKLNVTGLAIPGEPFVVAGHNHKIAWGMTNIMVDDIDLYLEKINPENPDEYWFMNEWKQMEIREELIRIKGGDSALIKTRFTHRGPIVSGFKNIEQAISMKWIGYDYSNVFRSIYLLNKAENWDDFKDAIKTFIDVSQNIVYADNEGNIGLYAAGGIPIRKGEEYLIKPGQTDEFDWTGKVPFEELPHVYNPESGFVASANNKSVDDSYPYYISSYFAQGYRYQRIVEMLQSKENLSTEDFVQMQSDQNSMLVKRFFPDLLKSLEKQELNALGIEGLRILGDWNGSYGAESPAALIFESLYHKMIRNLIEDDLGYDLFEEYHSNGGLVKSFMERFWDEKNSLWCDDIRTNNYIESFDEIVHKSYVQVMNELLELYGSEVETWSWGDMHQFTMAHPLGKVKMLDRIFHLNRGPVPVGGSFHTVSPYTYPFSSPFKVNHGASHRHIYNTKDWDKSITIIPTGESGIPASKHYLDQFDMYLNNKYHADLFSRKEVQKHTRYTTRFFGMEKK